MGVYVKGMDMPKLCFGCACYDRNTGDEWCNDCKEYDKERHCCPRWNRVIRQALKDAQPEQRWIPCSERLPENGHYYLWCSDMGHVQSDYYWNGFENGMKYGYNIVAWMPLPKAWNRRAKDE